MGDPAPGNAPTGDPGTQHCVTGTAVVVVVDVVVVVVGAVVVVVVDVVVVEVDVVVEVGVVVVVSGAQETSTRRLAASSVAQAAPVNVAPVPRTSCALGALMNARIVLVGPELHALTQHIQERRRSVVGSRQQAAVPHPQVARNVDHGLRRTRDLNRRAAARVDGAERVRTGKRSRVAPFRSSTLP